jgi:hypothetical protein
MKWFRAFKAALNPGDCCPNLISYNAQYHLLIHLLRLFLVEEINVAGFFTITFDIYFSSYLYSFKTFSFDFLIIHRMKVGDLSISVVCKLRYMEAHQFYHLVFFQGQVQIVKQLQINQGLYNY